MADKPTIQGCNFSHDAIAQWMVANPGGKLKDCAEYFGYTQPWLSVIIHSDAFRARYEGLLGEADAAVINDIPAKIRGMASLALDGLGNAIEVAVRDESTLLHRNFLLETSDKLLRDLGYGPQKAQPLTAPGHVQNQQNNFYVAADPAMLERARARMLESKTVMTIPSFITIPDAEPSTAPT